MPGQEGVTNTGEKNEVNPSGGEARPCRGNEARISAVMQHSELPVVYIKIDAKPKIPVSTSAAPIFLFSLDEAIV